MEIWYYTQKSNWQRFFALREEITIFLRNEIKSDITEVQYKM